MWSSRSHSSRWIIAALLVAASTLASCRHASRNDGATAPAIVESGGPFQQLLVSGTVERGTITLGPTYMIDSPSSVSESAGTGPFTIEGLDASGRSLFRHAFTPSDVDHVSGQAQFTLRIPITAEVRDALKTLRVAGSGVATTRAATSDRRTMLSRLASTPVRVERSANSVRIRYDESAWAGVMVRDGETNEVLGFGQKGEAVVTTRASKLLVVFSDGVQSAGRWIAVAAAR